jgi:hypothetical protein
MLHLDRVPKRDLPEGFRLVHNFFPGPPDDPGRDRVVGEGGFRIWRNDAPLATTGERRCYCGWLDGREHYGTVRVITGEGEDLPADRTGEGMIIESSP